MLTISDQLPPTLDTRAYGAELYDAGRRARAGLPYALILPLVAADGSHTRCLIADPSAHAARARYQGPLSDEERSELRKAFAVLNELWAEDGGGAA